MVEISDNPAARQLMAAMAMPAPRLYANSFLIAQSLSDVTVVMQANGATVAVVNLSFTSVKTLAIQLNQVVSDFENATGQKLLSMMEVQEKTMSAKGGPDVQL